MIGPIHRAHIVVSQGEVRLVPGLSANNKKGRARSQTGGLGPDSPMSLLAEERKSGRTDRNFRV
jgi:hypothetical protein